VAIAVCVLFNSCLTTTGSCVHTLAVVTVGAVVAAVAVVTLVLSVTVSIAEGGPLLAGPRGSGPVFFWTAELPTDARDCASGRRGRGASPGRSPYHGRGGHPCGESSHGDGATATARGAASDAAPDHGRGHGHDRSRNATRQTEEYGPTAAA